MTENLRRFTISNSDHHKKKSTSYLFQSISIAIQRGNAASVMGTVYNDRKLEEIYNL